MVSAFMPPEVCNRFKKTSLENILVNNELIELLKKIPDTTIWGIGIQIAFCTNYDPSLLVSDLRSQAKDSPEVLQSIIGQKAFDLLMANA